MKIAETVTFGGGGLDRAAERRSGASAGAGPEARTIVLWRGKLLVAGAARDRLARLPLGHPALAEAREAPLYLGRAAGEDLFAVDLSAWEPATVAPVPPDVFFDPAEQRHPGLPGDHAFVELRGVMTRLSPLDAECAATACALFGWHHSHRFCARCGAASLPVQSGWQRDCPACGSHHFPRTDPVVIMLITHGNDVLLGRSPNWPEGMYSLLAGFIEPGETIEAAVRREVWEEAGVRVGPVGYLASQPWPFPASLMLGCRGRAETRKITLDPVEMEDALWVGREALVQVFAGAHPRIQPARGGTIAHFLLWNWLADRLE